MHKTLVHVTAIGYSNDNNNATEIEMYKTTKQSAIDWQVTKDSKPYAWISNSKTASMYVVTFSEFDGEYKGFRNLTEAKAFATAEVAHV